MNAADPSPMTALPEAFHHRLGPDRFASTHATAGPWSPKWQHGGPPSALLGRAMEQHAARDGFRIARVTLELPRPVPVADLEVSVRTVRSGRRVELLEGAITSDGDVVMLARAWRMAVSPDDTPSLEPCPEAPPLPRAQQPHTMADAHLSGYIAAMEWRFEPGAGFDTPGPGWAWARQRIPLIAGEQDTPLTRALTVADSNWAVAFELDHRSRLVINTDVTLALHREPDGAWLCMYSATAASPRGSGLAAGRLYETGTGTVRPTVVVSGLAQSPAMSMIGEYLRVTAAELDRAIQDPAWALDFVQEAQDAGEETEPAPAETRHFSTYKTWDMLRFLLARAQFPVNVIHGEEPFAEAEDWGYGPPRYLPPERVRLAAEALRATSYAQLIGGVSPAELTGAEVYPLGWSEPGALEWGRPWYDGLTQFFEAAARSNDAILIWLD